MNQDAVLSVLGLARRAKKIVMGFDSISQQAREGTIHLLILAGDCSEGTKKAYRNKCLYYHIPCEEYGTCETIGKSVGKRQIAAVAVCDEGFAALVYKKMRG